MNISEHKKRSRRPGLTRFILRVALVFLLTFSLSDVVGLFQHSSLSEVASLNEVASLSEGTRFFQIFSSEAFAAHHRKKKRRKKGGSAPSSGFVNVKTINEISDCNTHLYFGVPGKESKILCRTGYAVGYRYATKTPGWVAYRLTARSVPLKFARTNNFREDPEVPLFYRATLNDYKGSGYDRGHMAAAASIDFSEVSLHESFLLTNIIPQDPVFNRGGWRELEELERKWAVSHRDIWVVTGPVFNTKYLVIGDNVAVPNAFFKVFFDPLNQLMMAFLIPHRAFKGEDLETFMVPTDKVEEATGYDFFPLLRDDIERRMESDSGFFWQ